MFGGVAIVAIAMLRIGNNIEYLPTDVRGEPWFDSLISAIGVLLGLFFFIVGSIRLLHGLRERNSRVRTPRPGVFRRHLRTLTDHCLATSAKPAPKVRRPTGHQMIARSDSLTHAGGVTRAGITT
jgi:hypothetical protein